MDTNIKQFFLDPNAHRGPGNLKNPGPKKLVKSNKSISRIIFFNQIPFFAFQKWPKINF